MFFKSVCSAWAVLWLVATGWSQERVLPPDSSRARPDSTVAALEEPSDEAVVQAARVVQPRRPEAWKVPASELERVIAEDIVDYGLLVAAAGALDHGTVGQASPFALRGMTPQQGVVMLDGMVLWNPLGGSTSTAVLPINLVEEFAFTGQGTLPAFGLQSPAGIVSVKTRTIAGERPYSKVQFRTGDFGHSDLGISFGLPINKSTHLLFSGSRQEFDDLFFADQDNIILEKRDLVDSRFFGKVTYKTRKVELTSVTLLNKNKVEVPVPLLPDLVPQLTNPRRRSTRLDEQIVAKVRNLSGSSDELQARVHFSRIRQESLGDSLLFDNKTVMVDGAMQNDILVGNHRFAFGGGARLFSLDSKALKDHTDSFVHLFVRADFALTSRLSIGLQGRSEKYAGYSARMLPSLRLDYTFSEQTVLWFGARQAIRYPSFSERFWPSESYVGNPDLGVEESSALELGVKWAARPNLNIESTIFANRVDDWIGNTLLKDAPAFGPQNLDRRTISGVDFKLVWDYLRGGQAGVVSSFLNVSQSEKVKQLQVPEYSIYSYLEYGHPFFEEYVFVRLRVSGRFYGERWGFVYPAGASLPVFVSRSPLAVADAKVSLVFADATLTISYENLFDRRYELVPGFSMPPRMLRFGVAWEFLD